MSLDGKLDTAARNGAPISSVPDRARVDRLRAGVDAVLVGGRTLLAENPGLTVKSLALRQERKALGQPENPIKVGVVSEIGPDDLPADGAFLAGGPAEVFLFTSGRTPRKVVARLESARARVVVNGKTRPKLETVLETLYQAGVRKVLVEGGGTILAEFFRFGLVDEVSAYIAPCLFGGATAPTLADGPGLLPEEYSRLRLVSVEKFDEQGGILVHYTIPS